MIFFIGVKDQKPRQIVEVLNQTEANLQCNEGEVASPVLDGRTISEIINYIQAEDVDNKSIRFGLLTSSDWTQLADSPLSEESKIKWQKYRQDLRDIDLVNPIWPVMPLGDTDDSNN